jgi:hypothetical protein
MKNYIILLAVCSLTTINYSCTKDNTSEPIDTLDPRDNLIGLYTTNVLRFHWFDVAYDSIYYDSIIEVKKVDTSQIKLKILDRILKPCAIPDCYIEIYLRPGSNQASAYFFVNDSIEFRDSEGSLGGGTIWMYRGKKQ